MTISQSKMQSRGISPQYQNEHEQSSVDPAWAAASASNGSILFLGGGVTGPSSQRIKKKKKPIGKRTEDSEGRTKEKSTITDKYCSKRD